MAEITDDYNARIIREFRMNDGAVGGDWTDIPLLLLHHTGAKTGARRVNPVAYLPVDGCYLVWAANGGQANNPSWYHNLKAHPNTRIELGAVTRTVVAEEAVGKGRDRLFAIVSERYSQFVEAASRTERLIPMILLTPQSERSR